MGVRKCKNISYYHISFYVIKAQLQAVPHVESVCGHLLVGAEALTHCLETLLNYSHLPNYLYEQCKLNTNYCVLVPSSP